jgi:DNA-binding response OmpR family regulator
VGAVNLELDPTRRTVSRDGVTVRLAPTGFRILTLLAKSPLEREALFERVYHDRDDPPDDSCFNVALSNLRKALAPLDLTISKLGRWGGCYELVEGRA